MCDNNIKGINMAKYNDEVWMDETPFREGVRHQILEETAPYTFKRDKRTGWETRSFVLDEVSLASLKSKLKRFKWNYDSDWIMAIDENGDAIYSKGWNSPAGEQSFGTLRDLNKAVAVTWERPYDQLTENYKKPGWNPKRRRR